MVLLLLLLLLSSASAAAPKCQSGSDECKIVDLQLNGDDLAAAIQPTTRVLRLIRVNLTSWPSNWPRLENIKNLEMDSVSGSLPASQLAKLSSLESLSIRASHPFAPGNESIRLTNLTKLRTLRITDLNFGDQLATEHLQHLPALDNVTISNTSITTLEPRVFEKATPNLRYLSLKHNNIVSLNNDTLGRLEKLENLTLDGNTIYFIKPAAFSGLPNLQELSLRVAKERPMAKIWGKLNDRFNNNSQLRVLRLVDARLAERQLLGAFSGLSKLEVLDLSGNMMDQVNHKIFRSLTSLQHLDLSRGNLTCLYDRNFGLLESLRSLNLSSNNLTFISKEALRGLKSLEELDLAKNPIKKVAVGAFCSLKKLQLRLDSMMSEWNLSDSAYQGFNASDPCPEGYNPDVMTLNEPVCRVWNSDSSYRQTAQPKHTFLIIIGLCVAFLLISVIAMMAYKGWSKCKSAEIAKDEEKELELQAMVSDHDTGKKTQNGRSRQKKPRDQNGAFETKAQVQHVEEGAAANSASDAGAEGKPREEATAAAEQDVNSDNQHSSNSSEATAIAQPSKPSKQQVVTPMTTVPEDADLQAREITTLVVV